MSDDVGGPPPQPEPEPDHDRPQDEDRGSAAGPKPSEAADPGTSADEPAEGVAEPEADAEDLEDEDEDEDEDGESNQESDGESDEELAEEAAAPAQDPPGEPGLGRPLLVLAAGLLLCTLYFLLPPEVGDLGPETSPSTEASAAASASAATVATSALVELAPEGETFTRERSLRVSGRIEPPALGKVTLSAVGKETVTGLLGAEGQFEVELILPEEGRLTWGLEVRPDGLEAQRRTLDVTVDRSPPKLEVYSPQDEQAIATTSRFVTVRGLAADGHLQRVLINEAEVEVGQDGRFEHDVLLAMTGENVLEIVAEDRAGNRARVERRVEKLEVVDRRWERIKDAVGPAVYGVETSVRLQPTGSSGEEGELREFLGTGVCVTPHGDLIIPKRLAQPWKFAALAVELVESDREVVPGSLEIVATQLGGPERSYSRRQGTLRLVRTSPDRWEARAGLPGARIRSSYIHTDTSSDELTLFRMSGAGDFPYLRVVRPEREGMADDLLAVGARRSGDALAGAGNPGVGEWTSDRGTMFFRAGTTRSLLGRALIDRSGLLRGVVMAPTSTRGRFRGATRAKLLSLLHGTARAW